MEKNTDYILLVFVFLYAFFLHNASFGSWRRGKWGGGKGPALAEITASAGDTCWYHAEQNEFTLTIAAQLYGLATLVNEQNVDFSGKTILLDGDIDLRDYHGEAVVNSNLLERVTLGQEQIREKEKESQEDPTAGTDVADGSGNEPLRNLKDNISMLAPNTFVSAPPGRGDNSLEVNWQ